MVSKIKIYIASPLGFSEAGREFLYRRLIPTIQKLGFEILEPFKITEIIFRKEIQEIKTMQHGLEKRDAWKQLNMKIGENNRKGIDKSSGIVAILDGPDVDSGTAAEIGYAFAKGKPIIGYRGDFRLSSENEGAIVNLQVEYFIRASGGTIVTELDKLQDELKKIFGRQQKNLEPKNI